MSVMQVFTPHRVGVTMVTRIIEQSGFTRGKQKRSSVVQVSYMSTKPADLNKREGLRSCSCQLVSDFKD